MANLRRVARRTEHDDFDRGSDRTAHRQLYDPSRPSSASTPRIEVEQPRQSRRPPPPAAARNETTVKKLFNPDVHDPHQFQRKHHTPPIPSVPAESSQSRSLLRRPPTGIRGDRTPEEEADRERERRRRREGSERGSAVTSKKKDGDSRSKGSRSSEGSESLRDRERGKGKA